MIDRVIAIGPRSNESQLEIKHFIRKKSDVNLRNEHEGKGRNEEQQENLLGFQLELEDELENLSVSAMNSC